jgi:hypothetical protein
MNRNFITLNRNFSTGEPYHGFFPFSKRGRYKNPNYLAENWAKQKEFYNSQRRKRYRHWGLGAGRLGDRHKLDRKTRH